MKTLSVEQKYWNSFTEPLQGVTNAGTGLLIGMAIDNKQHYVLKLAPTPPVDKVINSTLETLLSSEINDEGYHFTDWIVEHVRQVERSLTGGMQILGLYEYSQVNTLLDMKTKTGVLNSLIKLCESYDSTFLKRGSALLVHIANDNLQAVCRNLDFNGSGVNPVEIKFLNALPKIEAIRTQLTIDVCMNLDGQQFNKTIQDLINTYMDNISNDIGMVEGAYKPDQALSSLKEKNYHVVEFYTTEPRKLSTKSNNDRFVHIIGSIDCRAFLPSKTTISAACDALKKDATLSLRHRLELLADEEGLDGVFWAEDSSKVQTQLLRIPKRVFYTIENNVQLCDYMCEDETEEDSNSRFSSQIGNYTEFNTNEDFPDSQNKNGFSELPELPKSPQKASNSRPNRGAAAQTPEAKRKFYIGLGITLVVLILAFILKS